MDASTRRIDIKDLSEAFRKLVREIQESGEEAVLFDGEKQVASLRRLEPGELELDEEERDERDKAAWARFDEVAERITKNWTSPLSATEMLEEQRASRQKALKRATRRLDGR